MQYLLSVVHGVLFMFEKMQCQRRELCDGNVKLQILHT